MMKGIHGLIIAVGLGVVGVLFNMMYLNSRSENLKKVHFTGVKPDATLHCGDVIREEAIESVGIPEINAGNLKDYVVPWDKQSIAGVKVTRTVEGGRLLLRDDIKTPQPELIQEENEGAMWVPVDTREFVPSLVMPGDMVSFLVSRYVPGAPTPAATLYPTPENLAAPNTTAANAENPASRDPTEVIGPFKVLALGNRLGSPEVMKASKIPIRQENVIAISVRLARGKPDPKALYLYNRLRATNYRQVGIMRHPRPTR